MKNMNRLMVKKVNRIKRRNGNRVIGFEAHQKQFVSNIMASAKIAMKKSGISEDTLLKSIDRNYGLAKINMKQRKIIKSIPIIRTTSMTGVTTKKKKQTGITTTLKKRDTKTTSNNLALIMDAAIHKNKKVSIFQLLSSRYFKKMGPMMKKK